MDPISPIIDALAMTQSVTDAVSQIMKQYSNSSDVIARRYHSYIVPLGQEGSPAVTTAPKKTLNLQPPAVDLGTLSVLPTEIIQEICLRLNLCSLAQFKSANRRAYKVVDAIAQYQIVLGYPTSFLKGLQSVGIGKRVTCQSLYEKLKNEACETCGDYGSHMYLLKMRRICHMCFMFR